MKRLRVVLAVAVPLLVLGVLNARANTDFHRYGTDRLPCVLRLINGEAPVVDLAVMGGSRVMAGFDPTLFAGRMRQRHDRDFEVINLARVWSGADFDAVLFEELLERRKVRTALIVLTNPQDRMYHPWTPAFWRASDFVSHLDARPTSPVSHSGRMLRSYLERLRDTAFAAKRKITERHQGYGVHASRFLNDRVCYRPDEDEGNPEKLARAKEQFEREAPPSTAPYPMLRVYRYSRYFFERMKRVAQENGVDLRLLVMPGMNEADYTDESLERVADETGLPVIAATDSLLTALRPAGFRDGQHLNARGRRQFSAWLASVIRIPER